MSRNAVTSYAFSTTDAFRVHPQEYVKAVAGPLGDLRRIHTRVKPRRDGGVPKGVWPIRQRGCGFGRRKRRNPSAVPRTTIDAVGDGAAVLAAEQPAIRCGAMLG